MKEGGRRIYADRASKTSVARAGGRSAFAATVVADAASRTLLARIPRGSRQSPRLCRAVPDPGAGRRADAAADPTIRHGWRHPVLGHSDAALRSRAEAWPSAREKGRYWSASRILPGLQGSTPAASLRLSTRCSKRLGGSEAALDPRTTLIGFAGAPWTVATYMVEGGGSRDFRRVKSWAYRDPQGFDALIDLLAEATIEYLGRPNRGWCGGRAAVRQLGRDPARTGFRALGDRADQAHRCSTETSFCRLSGHRFSARRRHAA